MKLPRNGCTLLHAAAPLLLVGCARAFSPPSRHQATIIPASWYPRNLVRLRGDSGERRSPGMVPFGEGSSARMSSRMPPGGGPGGRPSEAWFEEQQRAAEREGGMAQYSDGGRGGSPSRPSSSVSPAEWNTGYYGGEGDYQQQGERGGGYYGGEGDYQQPGGPIERYGERYGPRYDRDPNPYRDAYQQLRRWVSGRGRGRYDDYDNGGYGYGYDNRGGPGYTDARIVEPVKDSFFSFASFLQTMFVGAFVGTYMVFPVTAYHTLFVPHAVAGGTKAATALTAMAQWEWELLASAVEGAWFATVYRNVLKRDGIYDRGLHFRVLAGFVALKTVVQVDVPKACRVGSPLDTGGLPLSCAVPQIHLPNLGKAGAATELAMDFAEAVVLFGAVAIAMNWLLERRWIRPYGYYER